MKTTAKKRAKQPEVPAGRRGAKSRSRQEKPMTLDPVPLRRLMDKKDEKPSAPQEPALKRADEPRPKAPPVRDADGRVLPGLTLSRATGTVLTAGSVVPQGGADFHHADRTAVDFLAAGEKVPATT